MFLRQRPTRVQLQNYILIVGDILLLLFAAYLSFLLRIEDPALGRYPITFAIFSFSIIVLTPIVFWISGIYTRYWPYASLTEFIPFTIATAVAFSIGSILAIAVCWVVPALPSVPLSIPVIFALLGFGFLSSERILLRAIKMYRRHLHLRRTREQQPGEAARVLIMGAGNAGALLVRQLEENPQLHMQIVGFLDDNPDKRDARISGVPVLGNRDDIPDLVKQHRVQQVIIAMPSAPGKEIRSILRICDQAGVTAKSIPGLNDIIHGQARVNQIRDVQIEDLLRREPIKTDVTAVGRLLRGKRVLVTGGGGSIGSELCRQILRFEPAELIVLGHGENSIFEIQNQLQHLIDQRRTVELPIVRTRLETVIADITSPTRIDYVFEKHRPEIVFHAAAHKHVPLMEQNPPEAIFNNVLGTRNLLEAALNHNVDRFVMISTDKAVNPTSIMGASKRVAELLVHRAAQLSGKPFVAVRFGNVLGSRGSVVLTFKKQIAAGGPVTVTDPRIERFFMTIPEAVQLVLQGAVIGKGGEVFTLDMGEPVKIVDLARDMIELSGLRVGQDIEIAFTGLRPGEKLYEELFVPGESYERTVHQKIFIACNASSFVPKDLEEWIEALRTAAYHNDIPMVMWALQNLIPNHRLAQKIDFDPGFRPGKMPNITTKRDTTTLERVVGM